jgi:hypothetical protein
MHANLQMSIETFLTGPMHHILGIHLQTRVLDMRLVALPSHQHSQGGSRFQNVKSATALALLSQRQPCITRITCRRRNNWNIAGFIRCHATAGYRMRLVRNQHIAKCSRETALCGCEAFLPFLAFAACTEKPS